MSAQVIVDRLIGELESGGRCACQLDPAVMESEGIKPGDIISIQSARGKSIPARVDPPREEDRASRMVRLDRFLRQSTKSRINDDVTIAKLESRPAEFVRVLPAIDLTMAHNVVEHLREHLIEDAPPAALDSVIFAHFDGAASGTTYKVLDIRPEHGIITSETEIEIDFTEPSVVTDALSEVTYEDVGGVAKQIAQLRELVLLPLTFPHVYRYLGINPPRGVILWGPPGTGKTHMVRALGSELQAKFYYVNGPDILGGAYGESEGNLRRMFGEAAHHAPAIIFIDELDALLVKRGETGSQTDTRVVTTLLSLMDGMRRADGVMVIGTTNRLDVIEPAARRPGRFDRELFVGPPDADGRLEVLHIHSREMPLTNDAIDGLEVIASRTHGYTGADLMELCREAGLTALRRLTDGEDIVTHLSAFRLNPEDVRVSLADFEAAQSVVRPSGMREALVQVPEVQWSDIGGYHKTKKRLQELIRMSFSKKTESGGLNLRLSPGIVLHGPSGTGKTLLAQAVAKESGVNFIPVAGPEIFNKWLGESEESVRHIFKVARQVAPAIIFFDQLDAILPRRTGEAATRTSERVVTQLLSELDAIDPQTDIVVLAATNRIDLLDPAALRSGRFSTHLFVPMPDEQERIEILEIELEGTELADVSDRAAAIKDLAEQTEGFAGADLASLVEQAKLHALEEDATGGLKRESLLAMLESTRSFRLAQAAPL